MSRELKNPNDYPLFSFRLRDQDHKDQLDGVIEVALKEMNKNLGVGDRKWKKNELIVRALNEGLKVLERERRSKKSR